MSRLPGFAHDAVTDADYVVVGSGSSGAIVAARLARAGAAVVLVEAGGSDRNYLVSKPGMNGPMHQVPQFKKLVDWGYFSTPQADMDGRRMPVPRGKVVGGSSSINGMVYVRGNHANFDSWAAEGNDGWSAAEVNRAYQRIEDFEGGADEYRGAGGPIRVTRNPRPQEATRAFLRATAQTFGVPVLDDYNGASQEGVALSQQSAADGKRYSSSRGYLRPLPPGLTLLTRTHVRRVMFRGDRAVGVEVRERNGRVRMLRASQEVILSAGFIGSPQLLMLSGVGPAAHLREHGIQTVADLPVGDNLQDHLFMPLTYLASSVQHRATARYFVGGALSGFARRPTFLDDSLFEALAFLRTSKATDAPDLQLHMLPWSYPTAKPGDPTKRIVDPRPAISVFATLIYPRSRGTVRLASSDPSAAPLIDYRYFSRPEDAATLAEGVDMVREIMAADAFGGAVGEELRPGADVTGSALRDSLKKNAISVFHGAGTCRMAVDETAVVGPDLRVRGVEGLRVADASIMPSITGGNTNAPCYMIGERAAEIILAEQSAALRHAAS